MNGRAFRHALAQAWRPAVVVSIGFGLFAWVIMLSSSSFAGDVGDAPKVLLEPPRAMTAFVGGEADFLHPSGWLAAGMFHPVVLALQSLAAFLVPSALGATELERGTIDLVLARPVSRRSYLAAKMAAALLILTIVQLGGIAGTLVARETVTRVDQLAVGDVLLAFTGEWVLFAAFAMAGVWIFARSHLRSRALGASIALVVGTFFLNFVSLLFDAVEWMGVVSPFHYLDVSAMLRGEPYAAQLGVLVALGVACAAFAIREFDRRDLTR